MHKNQYLGDRQFYAKVMRVAIPIVIQQGITNFVNMLDNIMVGRLGTDPMSGVSIVNELMFVFNLCIFGGLSGVGIFTAQFYGKKDTEGVRYTFRMQVILSLLLAGLGILVFLAAGDSLISVFLHEGSEGSIPDTFAAARRYLAVMLLGMIPFAMTQAYSSTLRNTGETVVPMRAGVTAVIVNLIGNYILIYGKFGAPRMGVAGAAAATVLSRFVELFVAASWTHLHPEKNAYIVGAWQRLWQIPGDLIRRVAFKATPLLLNETLWAGSQAILTQSYSVRGLSAVASLNISRTICNVFNICFLAMGNAIAIILGQLLGAGMIREAKDESRKLTAFSVMLCVAVGTALFIVGDFFPRIYNTSDEIRHLATRLIRISALFMPFYAYTNASYFILRSGGRTGITFLFDSFFGWVVCVPLAIALAHLTALPVSRMFLCVQLTELVKCIIGCILVRSGIWAQNLTNYSKT